MYGGSGRRSVTVLLQGNQGKGWVFFARTLRDFCLQSSPILVDGNIAVSSIGGSIDRRGVQNHGLRTSLGYSFNQASSYKAALVRPVTISASQVIVIVQ